MFFDNQQSHQKPMTRRQMDNFLRQCQEELSGPSCHGPQDYRTVRVERTVATRGFNCHIRLEVAA